MSAFEPVVYFRDGVVPASEARLAYYDYGIILGATLTDLVRTYRHKPFRLDDHLTRFYESCRYARIQPLLSPEETRAVTLELLDLLVVELEDGAAGDTVEMVVVGVSLDLVGQGFDFEPLSHTHQISGLCGPCRHRTARAGGRTRS